MWEQFVVMQPTATKKRNKEKGKKRKYLRKHFKVIGLYTQITEKQERAKFCPEGKMV